MNFDRRRTFSAAGDRRVARRAPLVAAVLQQVGREQELAQTANIGAFGMTLLRVRDGSLHPPATTLRLRFQLPGDSGEIEVGAEVIFDRTVGSYRATGVRFAGLGEEEEERISAYVDGSAVALDH